MLIRMDVSMPLILVMVAGWEQVLCQALLLSRCGLPLLPSHYSILGSNRVGSQVVLPRLVLVRCDAVVFVSSFWDLFWDNDEPGVPTMSTCCIDSAIHSILVCILPCLLYLAWGGLLCAGRYSRSGPIDGFSAQIVSRGSSFDDPAAGLGGV